MEGKDGSFDFAGTYTKVVPRQLLEYAFWGPQREGWQAILNDRARHVTKAK